MSDKFAHQAGQYAFPYHHVPHFRGAVPWTTRRLGWGLEYLCYVQVVAERIHRLAPRTLLDVGCGDGRLLGLLDDIPARRGVDLSEAAIRFARAFHPEIDFAAIDAADVEGEFDVVSSIETLEHVPDEHVGGFLQTLARRTRPGGHVILTVPTTNVPLNKKHYRHYDLARLRGEVAASGAPLELVDHAFVFRTSRALRLLQRATSNRLWTVEVAALQRLAWRYVQARLRTASPSDGRHLLACYRRS